MYIFQFVDILQPAASAIVLDGSAAPAPSATGVRQLRSVPSAADGTAALLHDLLHRLHRRRRLLKPLPHLATGTDLCSQLASWKADLLTWVIIISYLVVSLMVEIPTCGQQQLWHKSNR